MIYQLVLITNLGMITPLTTFPTWNDCVMEKGKIAKTAQYSAECLPTKSPQQLQQDIDAGMKMMLDTLKKVQQEFDKK
jgi:hypothetical protein